MNYFAESYTFYLPANSNSFSHEIASSASLYTGAQGFSNHKRFTVSVFCFLFSILVSAGTPLSRGPEDSLAIKKESKKDRLLEEAYPELNKIKGESVESELERTKQDLERITAEYDAGQARNDDSLIQLNQRLDNLNTKLETGRTAVLSIVALSIILIILTIFLVRANRKRRITADELARRNEELEREQDATKKAVQEKIEFLSHITHELRTPLYAVTGINHLLLEENPNDHQRKHLENMKTSADYLMRLISNILNYNKYEADMVQVADRKFELKSRLNKLVDSFTIQAVDQDIDLHYKHDDDIAHVLVGDPVKITQIVMNLLGNALKFTEHGKITVSCKLLNDANEHQTVRIAVKDDGIGISESERAVIFDRFKQGSENRSGAMTGTGLGLYISQANAKIMGSKIQLDDSVEKGSRFYFDLKLLKADQKESISSKEPLLDKTRDVGVRPVLLVEDNQVSQMVSRRILEKKQLIATVAEDGKSALKLAAEKEFAVILMDIDLPDASGVDVTADLRKMGVETPIIALTAAEMPSDRSTLIEQGFNDLIIKPFEIQKFYDILDKHLTSA